ncbi:MAG: hypothetical protein K9H16_04495 [Bacteroidales bacterium]|nr:hypothetical protein [Bacteroidales bacterium]
MSKKNISIFNVALFAIFIIKSCKPRELIIVENKYIPECIEYAFDDLEYYRSLGTSADAYYQRARQEAIEDAQDKIRRRLNDLVTCVVQEYLCISTLLSFIEIPEADLVSAGTTAVEKMIGDAIQTCEIRSIDNLGRYNVYFSIEIPKCLANSWSEELMNDNKIGYFEETIEYILKKYEHKGLYP